MPHKLLVMPGEDHGWKATEKLGFWVQPEVSDAQQLGLILEGGGESFHDRRDLGFSVVWELSPDFVLRGEYHDVEAEVAVGAQLLPGGPLGFQFRSDFETFDSDHWILSVSASF